MAEHSARRMLSGFFMLSGTSAVAISLSLATNKTIAVLTGTEGIALMGLFRSLGALVKGGLTFGYGTLFMQRMSIARSREEACRTMAAAGYLLGAQFLIILIVAFTFSGALSRWLFGADATPPHLFFIKIVLAMSFLNLVMETILDILKGCASVRALAWVQLATAGSSLVLIIPLLRLGDAGLAVNVGSGAALGSLVGAWWLWRLYRPSAAELSDRSGWLVLAEVTRPSSILWMFGFMMMGTQLGLRSIVGRGWGLPVLGQFTGALLIVESLVTIMMSAVRTQLLAALGDCRQDKDKEALLVRMLHMSLAAVSLAGAVVIIAGRPLLWLLFSDRFQDASGFLAVICLSLVGQVLGWCFHVFFLHKGDIASTVLFDASICIPLLAGTAFAASQAWPMISIAWVYVASYACLGLVYLAAARRSFGKGIFGAREAVAALACLALLSASLGLSQSASGSRFPWFLALAGAVLLLVKSSILPTWMNES